MSTLSKTRKDISAHPAKGSVTVPIDKEAKDADVDRKIRLYGVIDALRHHKLPSNAQIDAALQHVLDASPPSLDALSSEGRRLIQDVKGVVATLRLTIMEKNADEMIQDLMWKLTDAGSSLNTPGNADRLAVNANETAPGERDQAVKHLRTLLTLVVTNSEVRKLLGDFSTIGRDLLARGVTKAASAIAPSSEALDAVDDAAPDNEFAAEQGRKVGLDETPVLEARLPGVGGAKFDPDTGGAQAFAEDTEGEGERKPVGEVGGLGDARDKLHGFKEGAKEQAWQNISGLKDKGMDQAAQVKQAKDEGDETTLEQKKGGMKEKMRQFRDNGRDRLNGAMPQQRKDDANERIERGKAFFSDEYFPKERRDQFIFRGKKVMLECQNHDDYQGAMRWLISFVERYVQRALDTAGTTKQNGLASAITDDPTLQFCMAELRTLLERFANGLSMDVITDAIDALADDARRDPDLRRWCSESSAYAKKVLLEPGYILDDQCNAQGNKLRQSDKRFYDDKYKEHFDNLFESVGNWFGGMKEDPINHQFGEDWAKLTRDLLFDNEGSLKFKPELWNDIRKVILPTLIDQVGYIPIPRVEYTDEGLDLVIENLTLQGRNIFPNIVALETNNFVKFSPYSSIGDVSHHNVTLSLEQIQADMRDVAFYYRKKTGLPRMKDSGIADVLLGGSGLSATIELVSSTHDPSSVFKVQRIHVKVDTLKFAIRESKHDFLYKTLRPLATGLIKRQIEKAVSDGIRTFFEYVDGALVSVRDRMSRAKDADNKGEVLKEIFNRKKQEHGAGTSVRSSEGKGSQFKIVADRRNSILAGAGHPSGWVNRTAEMQHIARGDGASHLSAPTAHLAPVDVASRVDAAGASELPVGGNVLAAVPGSGVVGHGTAAVGGPTKRTTGDDAERWRSDAFTMQPGSRTHTQPREQHTQTMGGLPRGQAYTDDSIRGPVEKGKANMDVLADRMEPGQRVIASKN